MFLHKFKMQSWKLIQEEVDREENVSDSVYHVMYIRDVLKDDSGKKFKIDYEFVEKLMALPDKNFIFCITRNKNVPLIRHIQKNQFVKYNDMIHICYGFVYTHHGDIYRSICNDIDMVEDDVVATTSIFHLVAVCFLVLLYQLFMHDGSLISDFGTMFVRHEFFEFSDFSNKNISSIFPGVQFFKTLYDH